MKTKCDKCRVTSDRTMAAAREACSCHPPPVTRHSSAFTLVELLTVIAVMAVLAGMGLAVMAPVKKKAYINHASAELAQLDAAIKAYKSDHGFYPPCNPNDYRANQLYYELEGTVPNATGFQTLDGSSSIATNGPNSVFNTFDVAGFMNCSKGSGEDAVSAKNYLIGLPPTQIGDNGSGVKLLMTSVGGPDTSYQPLPGLPGVNPFRYNSSNPTNNPGAYDLWIQLSIGGKKYLICNWTSQVQVNNPMP